MKLINFLNDRLSRLNAENLSLLILDHAIYVPELMHYYIEGTTKQQQMAGWVFAICAEKKPYLFTPFIEVIISLMQPPIGRHPSLQRNAMKGLCYLVLTDDQRGRVVDICFKLIQDHLQPVAAQAYAVDIIVRYCSDSEDFMNELRFLLDTLYDQRSNAFKSKAHQLKVR